jgi:hypothetical protein
MEILGILALVLAGWFWLDSIRAGEAAVRAAREICMAEGVMLLDDTVALASLRPVRDGDGRIALQRAYRFEFSDTGDNRLPGSLVLLGHRLIMLNVGLRAAPGPRTLH